MDKGKAWDLKQEIAAMTYSWGPTEEFILENRQNGRRSNQKMIIGYTVLIISPNMIYTLT